MVSICYTFIEIESPRGVYWGFSYITLHSGCEAVAHHALTLAAAAAAGQLEQRAGCQAATAH
jgi:hypothetical protein